MTEIQNFKSSKLMIDKKSLDFLPTEINYQNNFFSKETISGLNKLLLQNSSLQNLSRDGKQELINILIKNMKTVFKSIETSKINNNNFNSIFEQFKKFSISESLNEISKSNIFSLQQSTSELKFERDFNSNPNNGNKLMERPESTKIINKSFDSFNDSLKKNSDPNFLANDNNNSYQFNIDQAFRPIVENVDDNYFNNHSYGKNLSKDKINEIQQIRNTEININTLPNYSNKSITDAQIKLGVIDPINNFVNKDNQKKNNNSVPDFKNMDSNEFNKSFSGLANDIGENLYDINNIDKPLINCEMVEDDSKFEDRLKKLKMERDNFKPNNQENQIDFTSNTFPKDTNDNLVPQQQKQQHHQQQQQQLHRPQIIQQQRQQQLQSPIQEQPIIQRQQQLQSQIQEQPIIQRQQQLQLQLQSPIQEQQQLQLQSQINEQPIIQRQQQLQSPIQEQPIIQRQQQLQSQINEQPIIQRQTISLPQQQLVKKQHILVSSNPLELKDVQIHDMQKNIIEQKNSTNDNIKFKKSENINLNNSDHEKKKILSQTQLNSYNNSKLNIGNNVSHNDSKIDNNSLGELNNIINTLKKENLILNNTINYMKKKMNDNSNLSEIKEQLNNEFKSLKIQTNEYENKINNLNNKELEIIKKEQALNKLINNYNYLFNAQYLQLEVTNLQNKSNYIWKINNTLNNVISIKLLSYSLPLPRYNIEENINNLFKFNISGIDINVNIPSGKYLIDELINYINNIILNKNVKLIINNDQKLILESYDDNDIINIYPTHLSKINFGFNNDNININEIINDNGNNKRNRIIASQTWDLRINDKTFLYLNNISDEIPFGILFYNGQSVSQFKFDLPFNLDKLEINFKDNYGNNINFYNLQHNLSFLIEKIE